MRFCPECKQQTVERLCPKDGSPTLAEAAFTEKPDPLIGRTIDDRYELLSRIGKGGMGTVYRARQVTMGRDVALKVLNPDLATDKEAAGRFVREAKVASRLRHPNTIVIHDFGMAAEGLYMAMELLEGVPLSDRLKKVGRIPPAEAAAIAAAIARSLAEAHDAGIVHRDLKPQNVFLQQVHGGREVVKVLDFGVAKFVQDESRRRTGGDSSMFETAKPMILGTFAYLSPEQVRAEPLDGRSDLYALGVMLHQMLSGRLPFESDTPMGVLMMHCEEPPPALPDDVPVALREVVGRLLSKRKDDRPANAERAAAALEAFGNDSAAATPARPVAPLPVPESSKGGDWDRFDDMGAEVARPTVAVTAGPATRLRQASLRLPEPQKRSNTGTIALLLLLAAVAAGAWWWTHQAEPGASPPSSASGVTAIRAPPVALDSVPSGATVSDLATGMSVGRTPLTVQGVARVRLAYEGYRTAEQDLKPTARGEPLTVKLQPLPSVAVLSEPIGATVVWLEAQKGLGTTPAEWHVPDDLLRPGAKATLRFSKKGYGDVDELVPGIDLGASKPVRVVLARKR